MYFRKSNDIYMHIYVLHALSIVLSSPFVAFHFATINLPYKPFRLLSGIPSLAKEQASIIRLQTFHVFSERMERRRSKQTEKYVSKYGQDSFAVGENCQQSVSELTQQTGQQASDYDYMSNYIPADYEVGLFINRNTT